MNRFSCEKQTEIIESLRRGAWDADLAKHVATCAICADTVAVSQFLLTDQRAATVLPDPDFLWWKAQLASKQMAVERATRSISLVRKVSYWSVAAAGLWIVFAPGHIEPAMAALSEHEIRPAGAARPRGLIMGRGGLRFALPVCMRFARRGVRSAV